MADELHFATLPTLWTQYEQRPRTMEFNAQSVDDWQLWRQELRAKIIELLGDFPHSAPPLHPQVLEETDLPYYQLQKVAWESEEGIYTPCYVLTPKNVEQPYRPVIALHGHGSGGIDHLIGRVRNEATRVEETAHIEAHHYTYADQLARQGFMVFAPEQRGFGGRLEAAPNLVFGDPLHANSCRALAYNAMMMGKTVLGMRVWDVMRTIDYIKSRPEKMVEGVGCVGLSGGGTTTLYATVVDERITVAVLSGAFSSFRSSIMSTIHCDCNYIPGILKYAEMADIAGLIAPRPLLIEAGTEDPIFPVEDVKAASRKVAEIYKLLDVPERFDQEIFEGGHRFHGAKCFRWFDRWLTG